MMRQGGVLVLPYKGLAGIYDYLVTGVDFEGWIDYVEEILKMLDVPVQNVLDLACGTGNTTLPFARRGYNVTGLDIAAEMLDLARQKAATQNLHVDFIHQDMRYINLNRSFDLITCFHDGLNYLLTLDDLLQTFQRVYTHLVTGGLFIFDLNTVTWIPDASSIDIIEEPELTIIWRSSLSQQEPAIWSIDITAFIKVGDLYKKVSERHRERAYSPAEVKNVLRQAGFELLHHWDAFTFRPPDSGSRRHFYVARPG